VPVWRDGKPITIAVTPGEWVDKSAAAATAKPTEAVRPPSTDPQELGLQLAALTDDARSKNDLAADQTGVLVAKVAPDSTAADRAFAAGDVILKVQQQPVATAEDVHQRMVEALDQHHHHTRVLIRRNGAQRWISVPIGP